MARVAVLGSAPLLDASAPAAVPGLLELAGAPEDAEVVVAFEPSAGQIEELARLEVPALLWREAGGPAPAGGRQRLVVSGTDAPEAWRTVGLPVADRVFEAAERELPVRAAWLGAPGPRRAGYLDWFDHGRPFAGAGEDALVGVNLHEDGPAFEPHAARALAEGRLLVSETLVPARGLEPGIDYLAAEDLDDLYLAVEAALATPRAFRRVRLRGRRKAELFRASSVIARLAGDLLTELRAR